MRLILSDSSEVEVELDHPEGAFDAQGMTVEEKKASFTEALQTGGTILKDAIENLHVQLKDNLPKKLELQIGIKFSVEGNVILAKGTSESAVSVKATWGS